MYYKHSGRFSLGGLLIAAAAGTAASLVLAYLYAHGIILIPEVHLAAAATIAFGALLGAATGYGMIWGKVRNRKIGVALAGAISAFALYASWAMWIPAILASQQLQTGWIELAQHPHAVWQLMRLINQDGTWALDKGSATKGLELWAIWALEAVAVIGVAVTTEIGVLNRHAFCEACGLWSKRGAKMLLTVPPNVAQLKRALEANNLSPLQSLATATKAADHLRVELESCEQCRQFHTMSITHTTTRRSKFGRPSVSQRKIVEHLLVGPGQADVVRLLSAKAEQPGGIAPQASTAAVGKR